MKVVGKLKYMDRATEKRKHLSFASIYTEVGVDNPLLDYVKIMLKM